MNPYVTIRDHVIWIKHVHSPALQERLLNLADDEQIDLETDGVVGRWARMRTGTDGRATEAIRPMDSMKEIWNMWFKHRRGAKVAMQEVHRSDNYLKTLASQFPEWESTEDEKAFHDL